MIVLVSDVILYVDKDNDISKMEDFDEHQVYDEVGEDFVHRIMVVFIVINFYVIKEKDNDNEGEEDENNHKDNDNQVRNPVFVHKDYGNQVDVYDNQILDTDNQVQEPDHNHW